MLLYFVFACLFFGVEQMQASWIEMAGSGCHDLTLSDGDETQKICYTHVATTGDSYIASPPYQYSGSLAKYYVYEDEEGGAYYDGVEVSVEWPHIVSVEWPNVHKPESECTVRVDDVTCNSCSLCGSIAFTDLPYGARVSADCTNVPHGRRTSCEPVDPIFFPLKIRASGDSGDSGGSSGGGGKPSSPRGYCFKVMRERCDRICGPSPNRKNANRRKCVAQPLLAQDERRQARRPIAVHGAVSAATAAVVRFRNTANSNLRCVL